MICHSEITNPEIQNSIEINELPNNGVLPRDTIIHHTCVPGKSNDSPIKRVYYHGGHLADWFRNRLARNRLARNRLAQHECISCKTNLSKALRNRFLKLSCDSRFQLAFTACSCVFKEITLV